MVLVYQKQLLINAAKYQNIFKNYLQFSTMKLERTWEATYLQQSVNILGQSRKSS